MKPAFRHVLLSGLCLFAATAAASGVTVQVHDAAGRPLADVVVYAEPEPVLALPKPMKAGEIVQKGMKFLPMVTVIQTGSRISFPNNDKVRHHIYSFSAAKKFEQKLYSGVAASPQVFEKPGTVVLGCNIHDRMIAYIKVVDTPFFAKTDAAGNARIELPAAGKHTLKAWHFNMAANAPLEQAIAVKGGETSAAAFTVALKPPVDDDDDYLEYDAHDPEHEHNEHKHGAAPRR